MRPRHATGGVVHSPDGGAEDRHRRLLQRSNTHDAPATAGPSRGDESAVHCARVGSRTGRSGGPRLRGDPPDGGGSADLQPHCGSSVRFGRCRIDPMRRDACSTGRHLRRAGARVPPHDQLGFRRAGRPAREGCDVSERAIDRHNRKRQRRMARRSACVARRAGRRGAYVSANQAIMTASTTTPASHHAGIVAPMSSTGAARATSAGPRSVFGMIGAPVRPARRPYHTPSRPP
jgi:hypothetical protein